jgi:hypothetical protein
VRITEAHANACGMTMLVREIQTQYAAARKAGDKDTMEALEHEATIAEAGAMVGRNGIEAEYLKPSICALLNELQSIPAGAISGDVHDKVVRLLVNTWPELKGADETSMKSWKVSRAENLCWNPPFLSFTIERHGAFVLGSKRADLHEWEINMETLTASHQEGRYRQLIPNSPRLDLKAIAAGVCEARRRQLSWPVSDNYLGR